MDHSLPLDGASLAWPWALPFVGILLSIAVGPLLFPKLWHAHYGKIVVAWAVLTLTPLAIFQGASVALATVLQVMLSDYVSFILLLFALYTVAGGILVSGSIARAPGPMSVSSRSAPWLRASSAPPARRSSSCGR